MGLRGLPPPTTLSMPLPMSAMLLFFRFLLLVSPSFSSSRVPTTPSMVAPPAKNPRKRSSVWALLLPPVVLSKVTMVLLGLGGKETEEKGAREEEGVLCGGWVGLGVGCSSDRVCGPRA